MIEFISNKIIPFLSNREWAGIVWFICACCNKSIRDAIVNFLKHFMAPKLLLIHISTYLYLGICVLFMYILNIWTCSLLKHTIIYVFGTSLILILNTVNKKHNNLFTKYVCDTITVVVIIKVYINWYPFSFWIELILFPIVYFLIFKIIQKQDSVALTILILLMGIIISYCFYQTLRYPLSKEFFKVILLPTILTILYIPYLYFFVLYAEYESWFVNLRYNTLYRKSKEYKYKKRLIFKYCNINLLKVRFFSKNLHLYSTQSQEQLVKELKKWNRMYNEK
jgi:hypothetical protein